MKKWKILAIFEYFVPLIFFVLTKLFTRWGHDIENCIFAFFCWPFNTMFNRYLWVNRNSERSNYV